jgi:2',3'-cyclic-nucleotide 2'-phosphodiesterase (5'-nucleotidase family)
MKDKLMEHLKSRIFVQINDVYHIDYRMDPTNPESYILPRVETLLSRLRAEYGEQNVLFCLPGDFLNPANLSRLHRSRQMIDLLNHMRLTIASFGNHEFDFDSGHFTPDDLADRIEESKFHWLASNYVPSGQFGAGVIPKGSRITSMIGGIQMSPDHFLYVIGLMYPASFKDVGRFTRPAEQCDFLIDEVKQDFFDRDGFFKPARASVVALTHQNRDDDAALARAVPSLRLIMGGHDHEEERAIGDPTTPVLIVKGLSNARSVRLNFVGWIPRKVISELRTANGALPDDFLDTAASVSWRPILDCALGLKQASVTSADDDVSAYIERYADETFDLARVVVHEFNDDGCVIVATAVVHTTHPGFGKLVEPEPATTNLIREWIARSGNYGSVLTVATVALDTDDDAGRSRSTNFGDFVTDCLSGMNGLGGQSQPVAHVALMDGGSFRLDRKIAQGEKITEGTLADLLFYDNTLELYRMRGDQLLAILIKALKFRPRGGQFLQISGLEVVVKGHYGLSSVESVSLVDQSGKRGPLETSAYYDVATTSYVAWESEYTDIFAQCAHKRQLAASVRELVKAEILAHGVRIPKFHTRWLFPAEETA